MIRKEEISRIGQFNKPHGVKGELSFTFSNDVFDGSDCRFLICEMDAIPVPFLIESYRFRSDVTALIKLKGVDSEEDARKLAGHAVYFPTAYISPADVASPASWDYFIGYTVEDIVLGAIGRIVEIETSTINTLFIIENEDKEYLVPATDEWIVGLDAESKILQVELPEGLIDL